MNKLTAFIDAAALQKASLAGTTAVKDIRRALHLTR
jgi:hypothetical protein